MTAASFPVSYQYLVVSGDGTRTLEEGGERQIALPDGEQFVEAGHIATVGFVRAKASS